MAVVNITLENFAEEVLESKVPVLVDFFATWCGPCMMVSPIVDEISEEYDDVKICKVNVDEEPDLAKEFDVFSIPTLMVVKDGKIAETQVGALPKEGILKLLGK